MPSVNVLGVNMADPVQVTRGAFTYSIEGELVTCTLGDPKDPESEHVFALDHSYLPEVIAGLQAIVRSKKRQARRGKDG